MRLMVTDSLQFAFLSQKTGHPQKFRTSAATRRKEIRFPGNCRLFRQALLKRFPL